MSEKQDRAYARTAQDIERKYSFGKSFAEMLGLINDNRDKVDSVESELRDEITQQYTTLRRDAKEIAMEVVSEGVDKVVTKTGYVFDADGMNISKSGEAISNLLTHEGMYVKKSSGNVLKADKDGVKATDLHADTYLIVGKDEGTSRFEDYVPDVEKRVACFWIGG